ncbi:Uncharacterized protein TCM_001336 [Theobroma cacao]|uniref:Uncharacterized protein n=1 Tax=Theobroma cacao TaxID=3641 RepID=A0A061DK37_THECC|nr:Uncharacterized protein TCM_001336 [Theobroma cacao]
MMQMLMIILMRFINRTRTDPRFPEIGLGVRLRTEKVSKFSSPRDIPERTRLYKLFWEIPSSELPHHLQDKYIKFAFLNGMLEEEIYVQQPKDFEFLIWLEAGPRYWCNRIDTYLTKKGFIKSCNEAIFYILSLEELHYGSLKNISHRSIMIGCLLYICLFCPDIMFPVSLFSRFMEEPTNLHLIVANQILKYLKDTLNYVLHFSQKFDIVLTGYFDNDKGRNVDDSKNTTSYVFHLEMGFSHGTHINKMCDNNSKQVAGFMGYFYLRMFWRVWLGGSDMEIVKSYLIKYNSLNSYTIERFIDLGGDSSCRALGPWVYKGKGRSMLWDLAHVVMFSPLSPPLRVVMCLGFEGLESWDFAGLCGWSVQRQGLCLFVEVKGASFFGASVLFSRLSFDRGFNFLRAFVGMISLFFFFCKFLMICVARLLCVYRGFFLFTAAKGFLCSIFAYCTRVM